jgi:hypothetical protein
MVSSGLCGRATGAWFRPKRNPLDMRFRSAWPKAVVFAALLSTSCYDFHLTGPEDPAPVSPPFLVSVTVEYRQPNECVEGSPRERCDDKVVFFGSWMQPGGEFVLTREPGRFVWKGVATGVPVNYPPREQPHYVRVFDPHMVGAPTGGVAAERLTVGGEYITRFDKPGGTQESGLIYVDANGYGHNAF